MHTRRLSKNGLVIGVIDTGVDCAHPWLGACEIQGEGVRATDATCRWVRDFRDLVGHGTGIVALIHWFCPAARIYVLRVAGVRGALDITAAPRVLAEGIDRCLDHGVGVINISYSLDASADIGVVDAACERAYQAGTFVVASYRNRTTQRAFPAGFRTVIGVRRDPRLRPGQVRVLSGADKDVAAWGGPLDAAYLKGTVVRGARGTSYACAHVAAMLGRVRLVDPGADWERAVTMLATTANGVGL